MTCYFFFRNHTRPSGLSLPLYRLTSGCLTISGFFSQLNMSCDMSSSLYFTLRLLLSFGLSQFTSRYDTCRQFILVQTWDRLGNDFFAASLSRSQETLLEPATYEVRKISFAQASNSFHRNLRVFLSFLGGKFEVWACKEKRGCCVHCSAQSFIMIS